MIEVALQGERVLIRLRVEVVSQRPRSKGHDGEGTTS